MLDANLLARVKNLRSGTAKENKEFDKLVADELKRQMEADKIPYDWKPRPYQKKAWDYLNGGGKRVCLIWPRRAGKDDLALNWTARAAHRRVGEYWHMLPEASQARKAIWDAVSPHTGKRRIDQAFPLELRSNTRNNDMAIQFKIGSLWRVVGSDNYTSLLGSTPAGIVYSEWALADPQARAFLRPILVENKGWEIFVTTPRGSNHARKTYEGFLADSEAFAELLTAADTKVFTQEQLNKELSDYQREYGEEEGYALFEQEFNCSFESALVGSYYGPYLTRAQKAGRIGAVPVDRGALVHTSWDLGVSDSTAIWFVQCVGKERRLIDYYENSGIGLEEYVAVLQEKQRDHRWVYGHHFFPHDIEVRELSSPNALSRAKTLEGLGIKPKVVPLHNVNDGINAVRRMLDMAWIDEKRCERGLNALRNYRREWSETLKMFRDSAYHDWSSHGADALRTFACGFREQKEKQSTVTFKLPSFVHHAQSDRGTSWMRRR